MICCARTLESKLKLEPAKKTDAKAAATNRLGLILVLRADSSFLSWAFLFMRIVCPEGVYKLCTLPKFYAKAANLNPMPLPKHSDALHILIVEDEPDIAAGLVGYLAQAGFRTTHAADGLSALEAFFADKPDLVLLDLMLPRLSGLEVLRSIRASETTPVIALTARVDQQDRLRGFELGVDDYIPKPFYPLEVVARVNAVLRRATPAETVLNGVHGLKLNLETREVSLLEVKLELRPAEFDLLSALLRSQNRVFTRAELLEALGRADADTLERAVDVHIKNLRKKLGASQPLETVFGVGYRYVGS
jgi:DNA-binding response OmpR family regulator